MLSIFNKSIKHLLQQQDVDSISNTMIGKLIIGIRFFISNRMTIAFNGS